jgi:hypothetical protein
MKSKIIVLASIFALGSGSPSYADSSPKASCGAISPRVLEVRTDGDLSQLTERERTNLRYYLTQLKAAGELISSQVFLYRNTRPLEPDLRLTLIFSARSCDEKCIGTAVLPGESGMELKRFSFHKNMIVEQYAGTTRTLGHYYERNATSYVFMDENERHFIAFYDVLRLSKNVPWWDLAALKQAQSVRSESRVLDLKWDKDHPVRPYYPLCFGNMFEAEGPFVIPSRQPRIRR